ncbi:MAG: hypothetical protein GX610_21785 [Rhodococcus sp.]|nr:hypothetical protein [Rhodococcus sp. (in: high G+C Gram-positive bacteria)]
MTEERRTSRFLPVRLALASAGFVGLVAGGSIALDNSASDNSPHDSATATPLIAAGFGPADALSSGS